MKRCNFKLQIQYYIKMREIKLKIWKNLHIKRNTFYTEKNIWDTERNIDDKLTEMHRHLPHLVCCHQLLELGDWPLPLPSIREIHELQEDKYGEKLREIQMMNWDKYTVVSCHQLLEPGDWPLPLPTCSAASSSSSSLPTSPSTEPQLVRGGAQSGVQCVQ